MKKETKPMPHDQVSAKGGKTTLKRHGSSHFTDLANKRWAKERKARAAKKRADAAR